jgi:bacterial/archaeal transporter family-2 protein
MSTAFWTALAAMVVSGMAVASQGPINARMAMFAGGWQSAALVSFGIGFAALLVLNLMLGALPDITTLREAPWWLWMGGVCGIWIVCAAAMSLPVLGAVTALSALVLGQMIAGLVIDATGAFGLPLREIGWSRIGAVMLVVAGLGLSRI